MGRYMHAALQKARTSKKKKKNYKYARLEKLPAWCGRSTLFARYRFWVCREFLMVSG
jgi:hypothetical protein